MNFFNIKKKEEPVVKQHVQSTEKFDEISSLLCVFCRNEKSLIESDIKLTDSAIFNMARFNLGSLTIKEGRDQIKKLFTAGARQWMVLRLSTICLQIELKYGRQYIEYLENQFIDSMERYFSFNRNECRQLLKELPALWTVPIIQLVWNK